MHRPRRPVPRVALAALLLACTPPAERAAAPDAAGSADAKVVAGRIGGQDVSAGDVDAWIMGKLFENATGSRNPSRLFDIRKRALEQMAGERALDAEAAKQSSDREALLRVEVEKRAAVSDDEVRAFYEQQKQRYGERTFEQVSPSIRRQLEGQKRQKAAEEYVSSLRDAAGFESLLEAPRFEVAGEGPSRGPADAPVTLVEFSDYQCPFCKNVEPVIEQLTQRYPTQLRLVYRHFPLDSIHPQARGAALSALCAHEQGKFWEYHRTLFANAPRLGDAELRVYREQVGLDGAAFDACVAEKRHAAAVDADLAAGQKAGVSGTPAFFVNGLAMSGARTLDQFSELVDGELRRLGQPVPERPVPPSPPSAAAPAPPAAQPAPQAGPTVAPAPAAQPPAPAQPGPGG